MSEYQYYEFNAVDKPLNKNGMKALRDLSTRAQITHQFCKRVQLGRFKRQPIETSGKIF
jgi:hypothetical protein